MKTPVRRILAAGGLRGELPEHPAVAMQIPTVMDASVAPDSFHVATTFFFPLTCRARSGANCAAR